MTKKGNRFEQDMQKRLDLVNKERKGQLLELSSDVLKLMEARNFWDSVFCNMKMTTKQSSLFVRQQLQEAESRLHDWINGHAWKGCDVTAGMYGDSHDNPPRDPEELNE